MNKTEYFAVFGDIHGRIALMYTVALFWQKETGIKLSGIIQAGDMGAYPNPSNIDSSTKKFSEKDPDELGFHLFCNQTEEAQLFLSSPYTPKTYFIRGNHEDFNYLSKFKDISPIDIWNKIYYLPDGKHVKISDLTTLSSFGGIAPATEYKMRGKRLKKLYRKSKQKSENDPKFFTEENIKNAFPENKNLDILITHAGPKCAQLPEGSKLLSELSERTKPRIHIFGHHHRAISIEPDTQEDTLTIGLDHFMFDKQTNNIKLGSWGILKKTKQSVEFSFSSHKNLNFLSLLTYSNYRKLFKSNFSQS